MNSKTRIIIIGVIGVVLLAAAGIIFVVLSKKNKAPSTFIDGAQFTETSQAPSTTPTTTTPPTTTTAPTTTPPATTTPSTTTPPATETPPSTTPQKSTAPPPPPDQTARCQGGDPVALSIACSKNMFPQDHTADYLYLSRDDNPVDAFTATPLIGLTNGAYLAAATNQISVAALAEARRVLVNQASPIVILGGTSAVGAGVENQLRQAGFNNIKRVFGANRYQTAAAIAEEVIKARGSNIINAFLTEGSLLVDAYGIGPVAAGQVPNTGPSFILLTNRGAGGLNGDTKAFLQKHSEVKIVTIVGGTAAVPDSVKTELTNLGVVLIDRIADINRVWTNLRILTRFFLSPTRAMVANAYPQKGQNGLYSAQAGAVLAAHFGSPLLMIDPAFVPEGQARFLCSFKADIWQALIAGTARDINPAVEAELLTLINGTNSFCPR